jgi:hypothetical protein
MSCAGSERPGEPTAAQASGPGPNPPSPTSVGANSCQAAVPAQPSTTNTTGVWIIANNSCTAVGVFLSVNGATGSAVATIPPGQVAMAQLGVSRGCIGPSQSATSICLDGYSTAQRAPVFLYSGPASPDAVQSARSSVSQKRFRSPKFQIRSSADVLGSRG